MAHAPDTPRSPSLRQGCPPNMEPLKGFSGLYPESQAHHLALAVLYLPYSLDSGGLVGLPLARQLGTHDVCFTRMRRFTCLSSRASRGGPYLLKANRQPRSD